MSNMNLSWQGEATRVKCIYCDKLLASDRALRGWNTCATCMSPEGKRNRHEKNRARDAVARAAAPYRDSMEGGEQ